MPAIRTNPKHCWSCRRSDSTTPVFLNGVGWLDLCIDCEDEDEGGPPRADSAPFPVTAEMREAAE